MRVFELPENPNVLFTEEILPSLVLGKRAERFFDFAIKQSSRYEMIAQNLQVIYEKKTLGEFDFFVEDLEERTSLHIELVYKFYLFNPSVSKEEELKCWIGPNRKDSFLRKINRLKTHQLSLLFRQESEEILAQQQINPRKLQQKICFKANLFVPKTSGKTSYELINPKAIVGYWMHLHEFTKEEFGTDDYFSPQKKDWPVDPKHQEEWKSYKNILQEIKYLFKHQKAAFIWRKKADSSFERFFVVWW
ncbi:DUF1853 family protein [Mesonia sp. MT50]|uniref:DUF1853 family protein n=1 Tax=Mesonia profundi TaxID=3070998 RepID=A0ABU0ZYG5_9FLAO|nr:DUF1853 family protein [Mesonia profundi]MDQ7916500.1 DUF1853 family protein [Mesonia profundi]